MARNDSLGGLGVQCLERADLKNGEGSDVGAFFSGTGGEEMATIGSDGEESGVLNLNGELRCAQLAFRRVEGGVVDAGGGVRGTAASRCEIEIEWGCGEMARRKEEGEESETVESAFHGWVGLE
jgi:hypothetical protein